MSPPEYQISNGLRLVKSYFHPFQTHVKTRWLGRTLLEVYTDDLHYTPQKFESQVQDGRLYLLRNVGRKEEPERITDLDFLSRQKLGRHDLICNLAHTHEPSVLHAELEIVFEDEDLIVVNKPCGIPTHPSGSYRYNSMTEIVHHELKYKVFPCHRLDKSTSGILILAKSKEAAFKFSLKSIGKKEYIARVKGKFPAQTEGLYRTESPVFTLNAAGGYLGQANANNLPLKSVTYFQSVSYNAKLDQSIVLCQPVTGRMHQIRIHLRNLGHPIVNDSFYNYLDYEGTTRTCNEIEIEMYKRIKDTYPDINELRPITKDTMAKDRVLDADETKVDVLARSRFYEDTTLQAQIKALQAEKRAELQHAKENRGGDETKKVYCEECKDYYDPGLRSSSGEGIWLHSLRYTYQNQTGGDQLTFETKYPDWSQI